MKKFYIILSGLVIGLSALTRGASDDYLSQVFHRYLPVPGSMGILYRSVQTTDGGFASVGHLTELSTFMDDFLIVKTNADGTSAWSKRISLSDYDDFHDIIETNDNGLAVSGTIMNSPAFISQAVVMKFDGNGVRQWSKTYSINGISSTATRIQKDANGFLYVLGTLDIGGSSDYLLMKIDPSNGDLLAQNTYGTPESDAPLAFLRKSSGEFFIGGTHDLVSSGENIHLMKLNSSMGTEWSKLVTGTGGNDKYFCYDIREKSTGNIILAGRYTEMGFPYDILLGEIEPASGNAVWANHYTPADNLPCYALGLTVNTGDILALTGAIEDTSGGTFILATGLDGTLNWSEKLGGASGQYNSGYSITKTTDGGYFVCGSWSGFNNSTIQVLKMNATKEIPCNKLAFDVTTSAITLLSQDLTVTAGTSTITAQDISPEELTLSPFEDICQGLGITENKVQDDINVYPDPSGGTFTVSFSSLARNASLSIISPLGKVIYHKDDLPESKDKTDLNINLNVKSGIYLIRVNNNNKEFSKKVIIK